jgi:hypothetical protein
MAENRLFQSTYSESVHLKTEEKHFQSVGPLILLEP